MGPDFLPNSSLPEGRALRQANAFASSTAVADARNGGTAVSNVNSRRCGQVASKAAKHALFKPKECHASLRAGAYATAHGSSTIVHAVAASYPVADVDLGNTGLRIDPWAPRRPLQPLSPGSLTVGPCPCSTFPESSALASRANAARPFPRHCRYPSCTGTREHPRSTMILPALH